jgi:hypothetical protein
MLEPPRLRMPAPSDPERHYVPDRAFRMASPWQTGVGGVDKARFDTRGKLAHVLYALLIFIVGAAIAGATGWWGGVIFLLCVGTAGHLLYRRFALGRTIYDPWP